ncbi:MAG: hypothetical protein H7836_17185 [Magnetococcus sp. YQC-3]
MKNKEMAEQIGFGVMLQPWLISFFQKNVYLDQNFLSFYVTGFVQKKENNTIEKLKQKQNFIINP